MKTVIAIIAFLSTFNLLAQEDKIEMLGLGKTAPLLDHDLEALNGELVSLKDLQMEKGLLVIFSCNTCPFVLAWEDQYPLIYELCRKLGVGMTLVNSNERKRDGDDSIEAMRQHAKEAGYKMPYLVDRDNQLADAFGAKTTPHVFLFDQEFKLVYRGSINDKYEHKNKTAQKFYLEEALKALADGKVIDPADTREIGCSIKRL